MHVGSIGMLFGGLLAMVGSFLPWITVMGTSMSAWSGTYIGIVALALGFISVAGALIPRPILGASVRTLAMWHAFLAGGIGAVIVLLQLVRVVQISVSTGAWGAVLPGLGMVLIGGGAVFMIRAGFRVRNAE